MIPEVVAKQRLLNQHACGDALPTPRDVVRNLVAVQAQDYRGGLWAVGLRTQGADESTVEKALADRQILRTWPMRGTLHLVAAEDARWMLRLLAPRVVASLAGRYRQLELEPAVFLRARKAFEKALRGGGQLTRDEMYRLLEVARISPEGQRGIHILQRLSQDEVLCFGPREGKQQTFVLLDEWIPQGKPRAPDEALAELALRYFRGHGPATAQDFAWWTGLTLTDAKSGLDAAAPLLSSEDQHYWGRRTGSVTSRLKPAALLLPPFDELLVAYRDRGASLDPAHAAHLQSLLSPTIAVKGRIVGTWTRARGRDLVTIAPRFFSVQNERDLAAIRSAARRYGAFIGVTTIVT
jgi:hypothetical protein